MGLAGDFMHGATLPLWSQDFGLPDWLILQLSSLESRGQSSASAS